MKLLVAADEFFSIPLLFYLSVLTHLDWHIWTRIRHSFSPNSPGASMKAKIIITPKKAVVDPQGITVKKALEHMGYTGVTGVHIGKYIEIDLAPGTDKAAAQKAIDEATHKLLSNPVIEDYKLEISE
jgi:phosphoribosylformylglycinamidine synthase subunit PurS